MSVELTNMIMLTDGAGRILVQRRSGDWAGLSFPGGHVEPGESFVQSAIREMREETGLTPDNLQNCGVVHWAHENGRDRYLSFLYTSGSYSGELTPCCDEGENLWMTPDEFFAGATDNCAREIARLFFERAYSEAFGSWSDSGEWRITAFY